MKQKDKIEKAGSSSGRSDLVGEIDRLKTLVLKLLEEIDSLNRARPDSIPDRYLRYFEEKASQLGGVQGEGDLNLLQVKRWADDILKTANAVARYLVLDTKVRPLVRASYLIAGDIGPGRAENAGSASPGRHRPRIAGRR